MKVQKQRDAIMWTVLGALLGVSFYVWGKTFNWHLSTVGPYSFFPLLGLIAWLTMWTHYIWGSIHWRSAMYSRITGYIVLFCILMHPGILSFAQYRAGKGFPPLSYYHYFPPSFDWAIFLGSISLLTFLSFEVLQHLRKREAVARIWKWVSVSQAIAMFLIFIHSLKLGDQLMSGWFRIFWAVCGVILVPATFIVVSRDFGHTAQEQPSHE